MDDVDYGIAAQCVEQIVKHAKLEATRKMLSVLTKQRDTFFPASKGKTVATHRLNKEIETVQARLDLLIEKEYDRWEDRCAEWRSDHV